MIGGLLTKPQIWSRVPRARLRGDLATATALTYTFVRDDTFASPWVWWWPRPDGYHLFPNCHYDLHALVPLVMTPALRASIVLFVALITPPHDARAQVLGGKVVDQISRRARTGLVVEAFDSVNTVTDTTRKDGAFMLALPYAGTFSLRVRRDGADPIIFPSLQVARDSLVQRLFPIPIGRAYWEFEVDHRAEFGSNSARMIYPDSLRQQYVEGEVLAQFVVEASGRVRENSFKVLRRTHELFALSAELFLRTAEFKPATIGDVAVAQLVQQPFTFSLR